MPIFAYRCDQCGFEKDVLQKRSDPPLTDCPSCGKAAFRKQLAAPSFQLKGSGWYVTDFRDNGKAKPGDAAGGEAATPGAPTSATPAVPAGGPANPAASPTPAAPAAAPAASPAPSSSSGSKDV